MATQYINQATSDITIDSELFEFASNTVTAELFDDASVTLAKSQSSELVISGGEITYTITITNLTTEAVENFNFYDTIPTGMSYITGTFVVNGLPATPTIAGQNLSYLFTTLPSGENTISFDCDVA